MKLDQINTISLCTVNLIQHKQICPEGKQSCPELKNKKNLTLGGIVCVLSFQKRTWRENKQTQIEPWQIGWWKMTDLRGEAGKERAVYRMERPTLSFLYTLWPPLQLPGSSCSIVQNAGYTYRKWALSFLSPSYCCCAQQREECV